eukprot:1663149-Rhodomonas_salina.1
MSCVNTILRQNRNNGLAGAAARTPRYVHTKRGERDATCGSMPSSLASAGYTHVPGRNSYSGTRTVGRATRYPVPGRHPGSRAGIPTYRGIAY